LYDARLTHAFLIAVACCATSCGTGTQATPPPTAAPRAAPIAANDPDPDSEVARENATPPAPPDPLAGKSPQEQWAWAVSLVPTLSELVPRPARAAFEPLGLENGSITL
jgi:hypothetical protein